MDSFFYRDLSDNHLQELPSDLLANLSILQELCVKLYFSMNFIEVVVSCDKLTATLLIVSAK